MTKVKTCVIPAAGLGKRFLPMTRSMPKEMLPLVDKPIIQYVVEEAAASGLETILIVIGKGKDAIIDYFDSNRSDGNNENSWLDSLPNIFFVRQNEPRGLADAVGCAKSFVNDEPFAVLLGDTVYTSDSGVPVTAQLLRTYEHIGAPVIAVEKVRREKIRDYGIIAGKMVAKQLWKIFGMVEKPEPSQAPSNIGITGTYILEPEIFKYIEKLLPGKNGELQLTEALCNMLHDYDIYGAGFNGKRYDIGTKELWISANQEFLRKDRRFSCLLR
jgi:UTP--glucose-1-phosphate uridylyltransferase